MAFAIRILVRYSGFMNKQKTSSEQKPSSVVSSIFEEFLKELGKDTSIDPVIVARLQSVLHEQQNLSPEVFRQAIFSEDTSL